MPIMMQVIITKKKGRLTGKKVKIKEM